MTGLRSAASRAAPSRARASGLIALIAAAALSLSACSEGPSGTTDSSAAVGASAGSAGSPAEDEASPEAGSAEDAGDADTDGEPEEMLSEQEIAQILLSESELPFTPDRHSTQTGLNFFQEQLSAQPEIYTESFGDGACTSAMDQVNAELVGEDPQGGVVQEYEHELEDRTESLYVWMLGLPDPQDSAAVWDGVVEACADQPLRGETDSVRVDAFESQGFEGIELHMDVHNGEGMVEVLGYSASTDYGRHLLMVSAANMDAHTFREVVELQAAKLATHAHQQTD
ncbi:hypothetical protein [Nesterenkonia lutea]|uniref:PknH-like extracellular domain-containing protein n=1 Tax=Nesterenkonia lutea TaxID=272919 RepID=A0ABR9JG01_9MICC|nr:hypothetical protein [Nesterenkonia lutea]MBE1524855.1 hypothetical protein [Nesterenkonia lutea]